MCTFEVTYALLRIGRELMKDIYNQILMFDALCIRAVKKTKMAPICGSKIHVKTSVISGVEITKANTL